MINEFGFDKFVFIGKLKSGAVTEGDYPKPLFDDDGDKFSVNVEVIAGKNKQKAKFTGRKKDKLDIKVKVGEETKKVEGVSWEDREDYLKTATRTFTYKVGDEEKKFLTTYDLAKHVKENWEELKDMKLYMSGSIMMVAIEGRVTPVYKIEGVYEIEEEAEDKLELEINMLLTNMSTKFNMKELAKLPVEKRQIPINAKTKVLLIKNSGIENRYADFQFKIDFSGVDLEKDADLIEVMEELYTLDYKDQMKPKKLKTGKYYKTTVIANIINSQSESTDFDITKLPKQIQKLIKLGAMTEEDAKKQMKVRGEYVRDIYLTFPKVDSLPTIFEVKPEELLDLEEEEVSEEDVQKEIQKQVGQEEEEEEEEAEDEPMDRMAQLKARLSGKK